MRRTLPAVLIVVLVAATVQAQAPKAEKATKNAPKATPEKQKATADIHQFFRRVTQRLADADLADVKTLDDWQAKRPRLREQMLEMLGLWPMPERTDLEATITGTVDAGEFVVEKLHFQSRPGLYVTANFYRPKHVDKPLPTILYVCGHGMVKVDGVAYGAKAYYEHHPAWFAREGYCCLILDTLQLGEIEGFHHGTNRFGWWWWASRGYTPAGVEAWNCVRALDYLETRPEVDMKRIGMTGRSGGGAYTWWTAAIDDRPACFVPVAGITDLQNHVVDGCVEGHCDCMYQVNTYGWDFATVAALAAPRPLLFSNSDKDNIFPLSGVYRTHAGLKRIYQLHNAADKLGLLITEGPHQDTQELQVPAFRWFNRWLKGTSAPITHVADKPIDVKQLRVFASLPSDEKNTTIHETFTPAARVPLPTSSADWIVRREELYTGLKEKCFRNCLAEAEKAEVHRVFMDAKFGQKTDPNVARVVADQTKDSLRLQVLEYQSEGMELRAYVVRGAKYAKPSLLVVTPVDTDGWQKWVAEMGPAFGDVLPGRMAAGGDRGAFEATAKMLDKNDWAFAYIPPRGEGPNQWDSDPRKNIHIRRRFLLLGRTLDDAQVWDTRRALQVLRARDEYKDARAWVQGEGRMAGIALYAGLFEPAVERFDLHKLPTSHRDGPTFLNVLRVLDLPQAVALAFPRKVILYDVDPAAWAWPETVAKQLYADKSPLQFRLPK
jgi:hypothetical protein